MDSYKGTSSRVVAGWFVERKRERDGDLGNYFEASFGSEQRFPLTSKVAATRTLALKALWVL